MHLSMRQSLANVLAEVELPDPAALDHCFTKRIEYHHSDSGLDRLFVLNEKLGELSVLSKSDASAEYSCSSYLLTPLPTLRFSSMLLSPTGTLLALCTKMSVQVLDVAIHPLMKHSPESAFTKFLYHAFDIADSTTMGRDQCTVLRIRWHPQLKNTLVILTSNSSLYSIQCLWPDTMYRIECRIISEVHLGCYLGRHEDAAAYSDSDYSSSEESDFESSHIRHNRIHANDALGAICVDFDFGGTWPTKTTMDHSKSVEENGLCVYVLFENGDIVEVSNCSFSRQSNRHKFSVKSLQILPPSVDNYGENFCSLLCISAGSPSGLIAGRSSSLELPPDVLILANRKGRLLQGVILRSLAPSRKRSGHLDGPVLCLLDSVDLELRPAYDRKTAQLDNLSTGSSTPYFNTTDEAPPSLALEPSRFGSTVDSTGLDWLQCINQSDSSYPFNTYYAIHDTGIHMIRLPWLRDLSNWCRNFLDIPSSSLKSDVHGAARNWHSVVIHLVCSLVPRVCDTKLSRTDARDFRLVGFFELHPLSSMAISERPILNSKTDLLFVRCPGKSTAAASDSDLVRMIHIPASNASCNVFNTEVSVAERDVKTELDGRERLTALPRSKFAIQLRRLLRQEDLHLPLITDLCLQSSPAQMQGVQFFLQTIKMLRTSSLDRLTLARKYVEQYTQRLSNLLPAQYRDSCTLASLRQDLQQKAEKLTERHVVILKRQMMLDKRVAALTCRLASLADAPSKAEVAMRDEIEQLQVRLRKGLRSWFDNLNTKRLALDKRYNELKRYQCVTLRGHLLDNAVGMEIDHAQWKLISDTLKRSTSQIRELINDVKMLSS